MITLAHLDGSGNADAIVTTAAPQDFPGWIDATGGGYLWHWDGTQWSDTAAAQAWRAQQATLLTQNTTRQAAIRKAMAIYNEMSDLAAADSGSLAELVTHAVCDLILQLVPTAANRTNAMKLLLQYANKARQDNP